MRDRNRSAGWCWMVLFSVACAAGPATTREAPPASDKAVGAPPTSYYLGEVNTSSPDGKTPYGPPVQSLVKRQVMPAEGRILEEVWQGEEHHVTVLLRRGNTGVFSASDEKGTFDGSLTFTGPEWEWDAWTYDIRMRDGSGGISGTGRFEQGHLKTDKLFSDPAGTPRARIREDLKSIGQEEFEQQLSNRSGKQKEENL